MTVAVSGGPDSLALLVLACAAGLEVTAVHVDHGIRPGSDDEAALVKEAASRFGAGFEARTVLVEPGSVVEARARRARYGVLPRGVMTGHTMDDQAETVLINLLRGAGLDGLAAMSRRRPAGTADTPPGVATRPLLRLRRSETAGLCDAFGLVPFRDPSNDDPTFLRNRIRSHLLPLLNELAGRDVVPILARQAQLIAEDADLLDELAIGIDATDARSLTAAPGPLARRAVRRWLRSAANGADDELHPPSAAEVARVLSVAEGTATACQVAGGRRVARTAGRLRVEGS
ncbi:MAG TPA: tRNA lysidine(34) synthetase TilS [Acidimicrobiales bacterium]|nr:tRNA lysidine(34) synthetase TilS [Acidimicrobiales bacterium]